MSSYHDYLLCAYGHIWGHVREFILKVYKDGVYKLSCNCAKEASNRGVQRYVEVSTAQMLSSDKVFTITVYDCV